MKKENENFLKMALEDLKSSRILYKSEKYPQAIFLLQQSIEKTTKGITGIFKHGHKTPEIYKKLVHKKEIVEGMKNLESDKILADNEETLLIFIDVIKSLLLEMNSGGSNLKVGKITIPNFLLQQIIFQHAGLSRYPKENHNPLTKYTQKYPLIKHYKIVYNLQKESLSECFKFIP